MKSITRQDLERRKAQAERFARDVLDDDDLASEIEGESLEEYAEHRRIALVNPKGARKMAVPTRSELLERIDELETENTDLQDRLDQISDLSAAEDEGEGEEEEEEAESQGEERPRRRNVARAGVNPRRR